MTRSSRNNAGPWWGRVAAAGRGLLDVVRRTRHWLSAFLLRGLELERLSLGEIRVVGAQLRREPASTPAKADTGPLCRVALANDVRQALKLSLKFGAKLKNDL